MYNKQNIVIDVDDVLLNFREHITDAGIHFDYKLKQGPSQTRNAIKLLHYMNFDSQIVESAETLVEKFINTKTW